ncbi:MAG TPA: F0F1 ATP synthase subunit B [Stellaceae bacterium]|nr:F0F1 ATP synthase subunit B [Stellaceae bacterium]
MGFVHDPEFWFAIAVLIFAAMLWRPAKRFLIGGLDARSNRIREELGAAMNLREEAERTLASLRVREREAASEAEQILAHAKAEAERIAAESARAMEEALQRRQRLAEERIALEQARAVAEIRAITVDVAIAAARRVITAELDEQRAAALIDTAIAELPNQLH